MIALSRCARLCSFVAASALVPLAADAQQVTPPDAGSILQQLRPSVPPAVPSVEPSLRVEAESAAGPSASLPFEVKAFRVTGNTAFPEDVLHALIADAEGRRLTLPQIDETAGRITAYYRRNGFPLSRAVVPAQAIKDGVVEILVLEARYGAVRLENGSSVRATLLDATLSALRKGDLIVGPKLDRTLLLLSDIPGVTVGAVLKPGADVGTSDLEATVGKRRTIFGTAAADNYGNRYIGRARLSATIGLINPLHRGDVLSLSLLTSGRGMQYGRVSYDTLLAGVGTRAGISYSALHYKLGRDLRPLDANGTAELTTGWIKQPLLRSRRVNAYGQVEYDFKRLRDRVGVTGTRTDRRLNNAVASLTGDIRDNLLSGALTLWNVGWTYGDNRFDDATARAADAASAQTRGSFSKLNVGASRFQSVGPRDTLYLNVAAQWADSNLDSAEKIAVGGPYTVRAYDIGAVSADAGYAATAELRHELGTFFGSRWQAFAFFDTAHVKINHQPWAAFENHATLSGAGIGLNWEVPNAWQASATIARRVGDTPAAVAPQGSLHAYISLSRLF